MTADFGRGAGICQGFSGKGLECAVDQRERAGMCLGSWNSGMVGQGRSSRILQGLFPLSQVFPSCPRTLPGTEQPQLSRESRAAPSPVFPTDPKLRGFPRILPLLIQPEAPSRESQAINTAGIPQFHRFPVKSKEFRPSATPGSSELPKLQGKAAGAAPNSKGMGFSQILLKA